jgi:hypothetical protein
MQNPMEPIGQQHPLRRLFAGMVEHAFCSEVGMCSPRLTSYMADLLVDFTHIDTLSIVRNSDGRKLEQMASMLAIAMEDAPASPLERDRTVYRRLGDFTLFWAGVFPEHLKLSSRNPADVLYDYVSQGKRSYAIVARLGREEDEPPPSLFRHLSEDFEFCLYGLNLVRKCWEEAAAKTGGDGPAPIVY